MAINRVTVTLEQPEYSALLQRALAELRTPQAQLRYMVQREFGLLSEPARGPGQQLLPVARIQEANDET